MAVLIALQWETTMSRLILAAALLWMIAAPLSASAQTACQQRCMTNTSGKGSTSLAKCEARCDVHGSAKR
jgi:hypothetical protein